MTDLAPLTALGAAAPRVTRLGSFTLSENADLALASLALRRGGETPAPFGLALPGPAGWTAGEGVAAFWTGPGQWMVEAPGRAAEDFAAALRAEAPGASVTEQTDGWTAVEIVSAAGEGLAERLLAKLVNLDPASLVPGRARRTGLEHMGVFVIRRAPEHFAVLGARSSAASLWHALEAAAGRIAAA
ncbi:sarcosine oxidase subunit gamma [Amaricoccus solimangrovi]|uniref:Sarcosine oxidase subunit gamma n=1 Tax=Amaricoccus solimangrovi TaxID=2589815 RepID=A0A501WXM6_9RHOB|nr:sarcosine oxidase subunit gamma [Amaricoccus solimangrovi]TPE51721.1 sarcosine oxidase subunit gamma [Amaricoccus solimangrovi]